MASETIAVVQGPSGNTYTKEQDKNGDTIYRNKTGGFFVSRNAFENVERQRKSQVMVSEREGQTEAQRELSRQQEIETRYSQWDEVEGRSTDVIRANQGTLESSIQAWMQNEELKNQIQTDPLIQTDTEQQRAREALAIEVANELQNTNGPERRAILRKYDLAS